MIRGYCIGGGLFDRDEEPTSASPPTTASSACRPAKLGLGYAYGGVEELMDLVGPSWTAEILFSARRLSADEALPHRAGQPRRARRRARGDGARARGVRSPPTRRSPCRRARPRSAKRAREPAHRDLDAVERMVEACFRSEDYLEGQAAFAEKRAAAVPGGLMPTRVERALARVRKICLALPDVEERPSHGAPTFFYRGKKTFLMFHDDHHGDGRLAIWCHAPAGVQELLVREEPERFFVPPYVGYRGWIGVRLDVDVDWDEVAGIVRDAYCMVVPPKVAAAARRRLALWRPAGAGHDAEPVEEQERTHRDGHEVEARGAAVDRVDHVEREDEQPAGGHHDPAVAFRHGVAPRSSSGRRG